MFLFADIIRRRTRSLGDAFPAIDKGGDASSPYAAIMDGRVISTNMENLPSSESKQAVADMNEEAREKPHQEVHGFKVQRRLEEVVPTAAKTSGTGSCPATLATWRECRHEHTERCSCNPSVHTSSYHG